MKILSKNVSCSILRLISMLAILIIKYRFCGKFRCHFALLIRIFHAFRHHIRMEHCFLTLSFIAAENVGCIHGYMYVFLSTLAEPLGNFFNTQNLHHYFNSHHLTDFTVANRDVLPSFARYRFKL